VKKRQRKKGLMCTYLPQMHKLSSGTVFSSTPLQQRLLQHCYNTIFTTLSSIALSSATSLQHHLCNIVFYNSASTPLLQHHLLQHHFNIAFATSSFATSIQHRLCNIVFCDTTLTLLPLLSGDKV
jgi:hypothetical protein